MSGPYTSALRTKDRLKVVEAAIKKEKDASQTSTQTRELLQERLREYQRLLRPEKTNFARRLDPEYENRQRILENTLNQSKNVDLVFLLDCTSSMLPHISETKNQIRNIVQDIVLAFGNEVKVGFVGYRDHCDGPFRIEKLDLNENVNQFEDFLNRIVAMGGGDDPEDVFGGIEEVLGLSWSNYNKVLLHIGDAPAHGSRFNDCILDDYVFHNNFDVRGLRIEALLDAMKRKGITYYFGKINNSTDKMIKEFNRVGGSVSEIDLKDPQALRRLAVNSVSQTISGSMGNASTFCTARGTMLSNNESYKSLKKYSVCDYEPSWTSIPTKKVQWLYCSIPEPEEAQSMPNFPWEIETIKIASNPQEIVQRISSIDHKWKPEVIMMALDPFAEGAQRISYKGYKFEGYVQQAIVLKEFKYFGQGRDRKENYIEIMETQTVAAFMAKQFNAISPPVAKSITFLEVSVIRVNEPCGTSKYYNAEALLGDYKTNFMKWNSNAGYVNNDEFASTLNAFSHWTYEATDGYLMVVDLQGVLHGTSYMLTDPSIHCKDKEPRFGNTNFGEAGFKKFFENHNCGGVCLRMGLKSNKFMARTLSKTISKTTL